MTQQGPQAMDTKHARMLRTGMLSTGMIRTGIAAALLLAFATGAGAQQKGKKLYCWNENGVRTCGDALPPGATDLARTEINARSGATTREVARALTDAERAAAAQAQRRAAADAASAAESKRHDMAMVESYATEADLRKSFGERISLLDDALKGSAMSEANLRRSLVSLLDQANALELARKPVPAALLKDLRSQHAELVKQQRIGAEQRADRAGLDGELAAAVERYRTMKGEAATGAAPAPKP
jgi:soluble cytochrome b562